MAGENDNGVGKVKLGKVGPFIVKPVIVTGAGFTLGASGAFIEISGALNSIASGVAGVTGVLSAIVIAPFTTCFGLIAALTLNPTVGSNKGLTPTNP